LAMPVVDQSAEVAALDEFVFQVRRVGRQKGGGGVDDGGGRAFALGVVGGGGVAGQARGRGRVVGGSGRRRRRARRERGVGAAAPRPPPPPMPSSSTSSKSLPGALSPGVNRGGRGGRSGARSSAFASRRSGGMVSPAASDGRRKVRRIWAGTAIR